MLNFNLIRDRLKRLRGSPDQDLRGQRGRLIIQAALSSGVARVVAIVANFAQVPIALKYLGTEAFGLWMVLVGTVQMLNFADLGLGLGMQNQISAAFGRDDFQLIRDVVATSRRLLTFLGGVLVAVLVPLCWILPWNNYFKVEDLALRSSVGPGLIVVILYFAVGLPMSVGMRFAQGMQRGWWVGLWTAAGSIVGLAAIWLGTVMHVNFVVFLGLALLPSFITNIGLLFCMKNMQDSLPAAPRGQYRQALIKPLLGQGSLFLLPQISAAIINAAPAVILATVLGAAAVAPFNLCQRIANAVLQLLAMPLQPLWPAYAEAFIRKDFRWILKTNSKAMIYAIAGGLVAGGGFVFFGNLIVAAWTRSSLNPIQLNLRLGFGIWILLVSSFSSITAFMNGIGSLGSQAIGGCASAVILISITPFMISRCGVSGAIYASIMSCIFLGWPLVYLNYMGKIKEFENAQ